MIFDIIVLLIINYFGIKYIGYWFLIIEGIIFIIILFWLWWKKYRPVFQNVNLFTGAPGTGKSKLMVDIAVNKYRKMRREVIFRNLLRRFYNLFVVKEKQKKRQELPILYSNLPIKLSRKKFSNVLTEDILLLQKKVPDKSVVVIDEFSEIANNQDWKNVYAKKNIDEFVRLFRQYTKGGYLFLADQSSDNILVQVRRRVGTVYNLLKFRKIPLINIGITNVRHLTISEDIKTIEEGHAESLNNTSWLPLFFYIKRYDTYAFSDRVKYMENDYSKAWQKMKTNKLLDIPIIERVTNDYLETKTQKEDLPFEG